MAAPKKETPHGTLSCGKYRRCKRPECVEAVRAYKRRQYRLSGYGQWSPLVDAAPARAHLQELNAAGPSWRSIARALGKSQAAITRLVYATPGASRKIRIRPEFSEAVLALRLEDIDPPRVPAVGTSRRIRALNLLGWPNTVIAERIGSWPTQVNHIHQQREVLKETADAVEVWFNKLKCLDPVAHGVPLQVARVVSSKALRKGARDPLWWEDWGAIDDPQFDPGAVERELSRDELGALRRSEIAYLMSDGCIPEVIAARLGMHESTVRAVMQELESGVRRDRKKEAA